MPKRFVTYILTALISTTPLSLASTADQITAVGSSTVYPFITVVAENFGRETEYNAPIIETTGTGGGMKLFCSGIGLKTPDFSNASREIKQSEIDLCRKNGVTDIAEIKIGYDGIILANSKKADQYSLTIEHIFLALARDIPSNGKLIPNPYKKWSDIDKLLPNKNIYVYGPPPTSGTRDAFVELILEKSCKDLAEFKAAYPNKNLRKHQCSLIREDGIFVEAGENDNLIIQKLVSNEESLGIFGYSYLEQNLDKVQGSKISGKAPNFENISSGNYPISRSLFIYVKEQHYILKESLRFFVENLISEDTLGEDGYLTYKGLIPLSEEDLEELQDRISDNL
ncbi:MAG: phosphate ABC transporter substrate-binding protein [Rickettsiales bacterium]|jgi:phosphate transport system substrate-binding protein|nr:phosphate ABC transporter substrate-binding protein [Rickettsiales bacterium]